MAYCDRVIIHYSHSNNCARTAPTCCVCGDDDSSPVMYMYMLEETKKRFTKLTMSLSDCDNHSIMHVDHSEPSCANIQLPSPLVLEPNEAYTCIVKQNQAYERTSLSGKLNPAQTIALKPNEAYGSVVNNPVVIYEAVV